MNTSASEQVNEGIYITMKVIYNQIWLQEWLHLCNALCNFIRGTFVNYLSMGCNTTLIGCYSDWMLH